MAASRRLVGTDTVAAAAATAETVATATDVWGTRARLRIAGNSGSCDSDGLGRVFADGASLSAVTASSECAFDCGGQAGGCNDCVASSATSSGISSVRDAAAATVVAPLSAGVVSGAFVGVSGMVSGVLDCGASEAIADSGSVVVAAGTGTVTECAIKFWIVANVDDNVANVDDNVAMFSAADSSRAFSWP